LIEDDYRDLLNFEKSEKYDNPTKAALALSQAIIWDLETDDDFWNRLYKFFSEEEIIELGYFVGFTMGQQRFNRILNLDEHLGNTGFENMI
jgi:alkylhydroperoxidase family enzyme